MPKKITSRFSLALTTSIILHVGLIAALGYSAWRYSSPYSASAQGEPINAIMVDSSIMSQQYQRQLKNQRSSQQVQQQQQAQIEKQAQALQQKQLAEQQRLKALEKERLLAIEKQQQQAEQAKKELAAQQQQAKVAQQQADEAAKLRAQAEQKEQQRLENERKRAELATQKALAAAEQAKQEAAKQQQLLEQQRLKAEKAQQAAQLKAAQAAKQNAQDDQQAVNDILGGLTANAPKSPASVSGADMDQFKSQITNAISNKFINPKLYSGKNCVLKIQLAPDGLLLSVSSQDGDPTLCREAISATKLATFPKPKSDQLYQRVKNLEIDFRPN